MKKGKRKANSVVSKGKRLKLHDDGEVEDEGKIQESQREVQRDLKAHKEEGGEAVEQVEAEAPPEQTAPADPYLMADATYIQKDTRWRNKQRTLVFCSRGATSRHRHLVEDVKKLLPHHKPEPKFDKNQKLHEINQVCELKSCNNVLFFESRKKQDLYMWLGRVPSGPSMKFQVLNIHTTGEVRLAGNCLLGSRPILHFDRAFEEISFLKLIRQLMMQAFGTPRNHPKSKPFHDHVMCFYWMDKKIWFRHYQVAPDTPSDFDDPERQNLTEIGPRFVLDPIRILAGSFTGQTLYANPFYMSPTALRVQAKKLMGTKHKRNFKRGEKRKERVEVLKKYRPEDPLREVFE